MARTLKDAGQEFWADYDGGRLVARIVPHDSGFGWMGVDLNGRALTMQPYDTPELALEYLPIDLLGALSARTVPPRHSRSSRD